MLVLASASAFAADVDWGTTVNDFLPRIDNEYVKAAASGSQLEIEAGNLVARRARDPEVKRFAQAMVRDHTRMRDDLIAVIHAKGLSVPPMRPRHIEKLKLMENMSRDELESAYKREMVEGHRIAISEARQAISQGRDRAITALAARSLPALEHHLHMAELLHGGRALGALPDMPAAAPVADVR